MGHHKHDHRAFDLYQDKHGFCRLVAYVPGDKGWKSAKRQFRVSKAQAEAAIRLGQLYVAVIFKGDRCRTLAQSGNLALI